MRAVAVALTALLALGWGVPARSADEPPARHGISLFGDLKYPPDFKNFDYVNPEAPKGGTVKYGAIGTFDTLNPFQLKGVKAAGVGTTFDTLMTPSYDEPSTAYGLVAESVEVAPDRSWVQYNLRREARFHDGSPITPEDVIWTLQTLKEKGAPFYRLYYAEVVKAEKEGDRGVRFTFKSADNRELPMIVGELPVLSKKYWEGRDFEKTTLEAPLGSGPYQVEEAEAGRYITLRRVPDYWAKDLPVERGRNNFDAIRYDYYRDGTVALEAFKAGQFDIRQENSAKNWAIGYDSPALRDGLIKKENIPNKLPQGMQGFGYNLRRPLFQDRRVREALDYLFDFEWANKTLFFSSYTRNKSYFANSELASSGLPSAEERKILEKYKGEIPDEVFTKPYEPPKTDGSGNIRDNMRQALRLLKEAGWSVKGEKLVNDKSGEPFEFEFLLSQPEFERIVLPFIQNLRRVGITANLRTVDPAQYENRMKAFDFDMTVVRYGSSPSPGNEQRDFWTSDAAKEEGSQNYMGVASKPIDEVVDMVIAAPDRASLVTRVHALDRLLLTGHYAILNWYLSDFRVAYWDKFSRPKVSPPYALALDTWWIEPQAESGIEEKKAQEPKQ